MTRGEVVGIPCFDNHFFFYVNGEDDRLHSFRGDSVRFREGQRIRIGTEGTIKRVDDGEVFIPDEVS